MDTDDFSDFLIDDLEINEQFQIEHFLSDSIFSDLFPSPTKNFDSKIPKLETDFTISFQSNRLHFVNPPEPIYHVRYFSEIDRISAPTKKHVSGRYLRGVRARHVTISIPICFSHHSNIFVQVTRLTVPYHDQSFIHPYPLVYSNCKKNSAINIVLHGASIYYKLSQDEIKSQLKQFPHLILTRLKQCQLKQVDNLFSFDDPSTPFPFVGENVKKRIANYQLKYSVLDFRLVLYSEETQNFIDLNIFCRTEPLREEEGVSYKKALIMKNEFSLSE